jgi:3-phosphoshikimate 1-carboxyvinyltransferase
MKIIMTPGNPLRGRLCLPGDKSISHRAALFASLAEGESRIENLLVAGVTQVMLEALAALGVAWQLDGTTLTVQGAGYHNLQAPPGAILFDCGNSGTTMRLLAGALASLGLPAILDGSSGLRRRPMKRILAPLQAMGVPIEAGPDNTAPLQIAGRPNDRPLHALDYTLPVASAQVKSCLLLAALSADGPTTLREPGPSRDHTERMLRSMGVSVSSSIEKHAGENVISNKEHVIGNTYYLTRLYPPKPLKLNPLQLTISGDISSAAFLVGAAAITPNSDVTLQNVGLNPTRTGLLDALRAMGADIQIIPRDENQGEPVGDIRVRYAPLRGTQISGALVVRMIDEFPVFAVAASFAQGETTVSQAEELRHKESDRIHALCTELDKLGVAISETRDGFVIQGGGLPHGGDAEPHNDHRLAMAMAVAGLGSQNPVRLQGGEIVTESFPEFTTKLRELGADIKIEM